LNGDPEDIDGKLVEFSEGASAGNVWVENCTFTNFGDEVFNAGNTHKSGQLNVTPEHKSAFSSFTIRNCTFNNIDGSALKLNGDADSTTVDPPVLIENITFNNCQRRVIWTRDLSNLTVRNIIIANSQRGHETFSGTDQLIYLERYGSSVAHVDTFNIEGIKADGDTVVISDEAFGTSDRGTYTNALGSAIINYYTIYDYDPMFVDPANGDFTLAAGSPLYTLGHDGGPLGDRNWATNPPTITSQEIREDSQAAAGGTLMDALNFLASGQLVVDELVLVDGGGQYGVDFYDFTVPIIIRAADGLEDNKPELRPLNRSAKNPDMWQLNNDLTLKGLVFDGTVMNSTELDSIRRIFRVVDTEEGPNYEPDLTIVDCDFRNIYLNGDPNDTSYDGKLVEFSEGASAGRVWVENCTFTNFGDEVFNAGNTHKSGQLNVTPAHKSAFSSFTIRNCTFNNIHGSAIKLNGDADSTTVDPLVLIENVTFNDCQRRVIWTRDLSQETVRNIIIANSKKGHETFGGTDQLMYVEREGSSIAYVDTFAIEGIKADGDTVVIADPAFGVSNGTYTNASGTAILYENTIFNHDPMFADADNGDFTLAEDSPVLTLGHDGGALGDRRWAPGGPVSSVQDKGDNLPSTFALEQNYPNPFNPSTTIQYQIEKAGEVKLQVYNILGKLVETLVDERRAAGSHTISWDASRYASGVYFYRLNVGNKATVKKMMFLK